MTATDVLPTLPMILDRVEVVEVERLSPSFVRITLGGPALADFGVDGALFDQRIKLIFPGLAGRLPRVEPTSDGWYADWAALPESERGHMRTYSVRAVHGSGAATRLIVDFVLHLAPGETGPGGSWAAGARPGDPVMIVAPRRGRPFGGIEFAPGPARRTLLVGDETAVPAVARILEDLPADATGAAFLEVPRCADVLPLLSPAAFAVHWLPREGDELGNRLTSAVRASFGVPTRDWLHSDDASPDLWETPTYSSSGQALEDPGDDSRPDLYAWIAGEAGIVTGLRRFLVQESGLHRRQVAFMGYWKRGVAMK